MKQYGLGVSPSRVTAEPGGRAIRTGNHIYVSGTAPISEDDSVFTPGDAYAQAKRCFQIIQKALQDLNADINNVTRTRMYVTAISLWAEFGKAHL